MRRTPIGGGRDGSALLTTLVLLTTLAVLTAAFASVGVRWTKEQTAALDDARAFQLAEGGADEAAMSLLLGTSGQLARTDEPVRHGEGLFWVDAEDVGPLRVRLRSTALCGLGRATIEAVVEKEYDSIARFAIFSDEPLLLASNTLVDSYDPALGAYHDQPLVSLPGVPQSLVGENAIVQSNSDIVAASNVLIGGDSVAGPGHDTVGGAGFYVSGATDPAEDEITEDIPPVPPIPSSGPYLVSGFTEKQIAPGDYHFSSISFQNMARLRIRGPATVVCDSLSTASGSKLTIDATGGPVTIFCTGAVHLNSNSNLVSVTPSARDVLFYCTSTTATDIDLDSNASFTGALFAPYADVEIASNFEIFGAVSARAVALRSNAQLHFDESLLHAPGEKPIGVHRKWWGAGGLPAGLAAGRRTDPARQLGIADPAALPTLDEALAAAVAAGP